MDVIKNLQYLLIYEEPGTVFHSAALRLLGNLREIKNMDITRVAALCGVSQATISRLARRLGCRSFAALKIAVAESLIRVEGGEFSEAMTFADEAEMRAGLNAYLEAFAEELIGRIGRYSVADYAEAAALLHAARRVVLLADDFRFIHFFPRALLLAGKNVESCMLRAADKYAPAAGDALLALCDRSTDRAALDALFRTARASGVRVVAFCSDPEMTLGEADCEFRFDGRTDAGEHFPKFALKIILGAYAKLEGAPAGR